VPVAHIPETRHHDTKSDSILRVLHHARVLQRREPFLLRVCCESLRRCNSSSCSRADAPEIRLYSLRATFHSSRLWSQSARNHDSAHGLVLRLAHPEPAGVARPRPLNLAGCISPCRRSPHVMLQKATPRCADASTAPNRAQPYCPTSSAGTA
jgi:hypothetical protein